MNQPALIMVLWAAPLVTVLWSLLVRRAMGWVNLLSALVCFPVSVLLLVSADTPHIWFDRMLYVDRIGAWVLMCVAVVYLLSSFFALDYMRHGEDARRLPNFYALFALFAWTMFAAPMANMIGVYWIGIELTTLVSTFLVGYERRAGNGHGAGQPQPRDARHGRGHIAHLFDVVRAVAMHGAARADEHQRLVDAVVEHVIQRAEHAQHAAKTEAQRDHAHVLDAGISQHALEPALTHDEQRADDQGHHAQRDQHAVRPCTVTGDVGGCEKTHDAEHRAIQQCP